MALLWGDPSPVRRGPRQRLDIDAIVGAAIAIADTAGIESLTMRGLAEAVGLGTMSLYTYVPGKPELVELMIDRAVAEQPVATPSDGWRPGLESLARAMVALYRRHPWLLAVATTRTVFGPNVLAGYEAALRVALTTGLPPRQVAAVVGLIDCYVRGASRAILDAELATIRTGQSTDDWWLSRAALLGERLAGGNFPTMIELSAAGAFEPGAASDDYMVAQALDDFEFGLARVLDGIEALTTPR